MTPSLASPHKGTVAHGCSNNPRSASALGSYILVLFELMRTIGNVEFNDTVTR